jgi:hypothetical protein
MPFPVLDIAGAMSRGAKLATGQGAYQVTLPGQPIQGVGLGAQVTSLYGPDENPGRKGKQGATGMDASAYGARNSAGGFGQAVDIGSRVAGGMGDAGAAIDAGHFGGGVNSYGAPSIAGAMGANYPAVSQPHAANQAPAARAASNPSYQDPDYQAPNPAGTGASYTPTKYDTQPGGSTALGSMGTLGAEMAGYSETGRANAEQFVKAHTGADGQWANGYGHGVSYPYRDGTPMDIATSGPWSAAELANATPEVRARVLANQPELADYQAPNPAGAGASATFSTAGAMNPVPDKPLAPETSAVSKLENPYGVNSAYQQALSQKYNNDLQAKMTQARTAITGTPGLTGPSTGGAMRRALANLETAGIAAQNASLINRDTELTKLSSDFDMSKAGNTDNYNLSRSGQAPSFALLPGQVKQQGATYDQTVAGTGLTGAQTAGVMASTARTEADTATENALRDLRVADLESGVYAKNLANSLATQLQPTQVQEAKRVAEAHGRTVEAEIAQTIAAGHEAEVQGNYAAWFGRLDPILQTIIRLFPGLIQGGATIAGAMAGGR